MCFLGLSDICSGIPKNIDYGSFSPIIKSPLIRHRRCTSRPHRAESSIPTIDASSPFILDPPLHHCSHPRPGLHLFNPQPPLRSTFRPSSRPSIQHYFCGLPLNSSCYRRVALEIRLLLRTCNVCKAALHMACTLGLQLDGFIVAAPQNKAEDEALSRSYGMCPAPAS